MNRCSWILTVRTSLLAEIFTRLPIFFQRRQIDKTINQQKVLVSGWNCFKYGHPFLSYFTSLRYKMKKNWKPFVLNCLIRKENFRKRLFQFQKMSRLFIFIEICVVHNNYQFCNVFTFCLQILDAENWLQFFRWYLQKNAV